ncbi:nicotinate-nucleotide pyrophosphorylase [carboxylating] [Verrucomicrobium sp. GAS474]|uniref:nicotinate-nucleotide diphosphorylase n=1 Tax=Verrucomicrobium sp. GAS474 TaxID=1882831 RepID=UPI00087AF8D8|nr:nicotinate-nucleotide diphosphorylase [Verrucomicrobium sp. GAS474]SDU07366.1 nicotinate-nucleotide pyrophosphorylase [carboxylating] [Verrucomicrobium sp. GAS474]
MASFPPPAPAPEVVREAVHRALTEDIGPGDITSAVFIPLSARASARIFCKEPCVLAGLPVAEQVFASMESVSPLAVATNVADGDRLEKGATVLLVEGSLRAILTAERAALNYLQHLSGVATMTRAFADAVSLAGGKARILDTRKTTPGLRVLEKYAVACGGGLNHRMGLHDQFLVKDNHLVWWSGGTVESGGGAHGASLPREKLAEAIAAARAHAPAALLEFEADTLEQVAVLADLGVDRILLDNMTNETMAEAVALVAGRCPLEASGNMTLERIPGVAKTGVDFISVGALTHSAPSIDFSLEVMGSLPDLG